MQRLQSLSLMRWIPLSVVSMEMELTIAQKIDAHGGEAVIPPPKSATYKGAKGGAQRERDEAIAIITALGGDQLARGLWMKLVGYHSRSLGETAFWRMKSIFGSHLKARSHAAQVTEVYCKCFIINKMTDLGMPKGYWELAA